jgi:hypothetical protein
MATHQKHRANRTGEATLKRRTARPVHRVPGTVRQPVDLTVLQRAVTTPSMAAPADIEALQRSYGNRAVQRLLVPRQGGAGPTPGPRGGRGRDADPAQAADPTPGRRSGIYPGRGDRRPDQPGPRGRATLGEHSTKTDERDAGPGFQRGAGA